VTLFYIDGSVVGKDKIVTNIRKHELTTSVVMCTYNGEQFIEDQLLSIENQDKKPDELLIADDKSTDRTVEIIRAYAQNSKLKIRLFINDTNLGFTKNFEKILSKAVYDLIFFADQDDIWYPNKVSSICNVFETLTLLSGVSHDARLVDQAGRWHGTTKQQQIVRGYGRKGMSITGALSCLRRSELKWLLPFPARLEGHDTWITYVYKHFPRDWVVIDQCLQDVRRHSKNSSEWIVNSFSAINRVQVLNYHARKPPAKNYKDRFRMNRAMNRNLLRDFPIERLKDDVLESLDAEFKALVCRNKLAGELIRLRRFGRAFYMLLMGQYKYFNGTYSFFRDLARRPLRK
jgi:glycosyltransferase involved in cell wall biosynthesis